MRALCFVMLGFLAGCQTARDRDVTAGVQATIRQVTGQAEVRAGSADWMKASVGQTLREGDGIRTFGEGQIDVQLSPHGGVFTVQGGSTVEVVQIGATEREPNAVAVLRLSRGRITGDTLKLPKDKKVVVETNGGTFNIP